jgi:cytochrome c biogenesis protein CcdA
MGGSGASEMYEVLTWLAYTIAAVVILGATTVAILAGLALRFVAAFLRQLGDGREDGGPEEGRRDRGS